MKTDEKIKNAKIRIAELERLIQYWEVTKPKKTNGN